MATYDEPTRYLIPIVNNLDARRILGYFDIRNLQTTQLWIEAPATNELPSGIHYASATFLNPYKGSDIIRYVRLRVASFNYIPSNIEYSLLKNRDDNIRVLKGIFIVHANVDRADAGYKDIPLESRNKKIVYSSGGVDRVGYSGES